MSPRIVIGVMGPGTVCDRERALAHELGQKIAAAGWVLLTGGRAAGVMAAATAGAKSMGGLTIGVLPTATPRNLAEGVDIAIVTDLGEGRNNVNVLSAQVVIACGMGLGTASEVALALKQGRPVILLAATAITRSFFEQFASEDLYFADEVKSVIALTQTLLQNPINRSE
ncbi:MAG: cytochrome [Cyanobacteria bacterium P01_H01_bin.15]